jgi:hypothetical protein
MRPDHLVFQVSVVSCDTALSKQPFERVLAEHRSDTVIYCSHNTPFRFDKQYPSLAPNAGRYAKTHGAGPDPINGRCGVLPGLLVATGGDSPQWDKASQ